MVSPSVTATKGKFISSANADKVANERKIDANVLFVKCFRIAVPFLFNFGHFELSFSYGWSRLANYML